MILWWKQKHKECHLVRPVWRCSSWSAISLTWTWLPMYWSRSIYPLDISWWRSVELFLCATPTPPKYKMEISVIIAAGVESSSTLTEFLLGSAPVAAFSSSSFNLFCSQDPSLLFSYSIALSVWYMDGVIDPHLHQVLVFILVSFSTRGWELIEEMLLSLSYLFIVLHYSFNPWVNLF